MMSWTELMVQKRIQLNMFVPDVLASQEGKVAKPGQVQTTQKPIGHACFHANNRKGGIKYHFKVALFPE